MTFSLPFLYAPQAKQLPIGVHLEARDVLFSEAAAAADCPKVMTFDMILAVATSYNPHASDGAGQGTSAWAYVRDYDVDTATLTNAATDIYCVAKTAVAAAARGDVVIMGEITGMIKVGGSGAHVKGQGFLPAMADVGDVAPVANVATTLAATAHNRKVVLLATNAATATTVSGHFNGFGWGTVFTNVAFNADP